MMMMMMMMMTAPALCAAASAKALWQVKPLQRYSGSPVARSASLRETASAGAQSTPARKYRRH
jgi:hypothetical protein